jgi:hypothetical protein
MDTDKSASIARQSSCAGGARIHAHWQHTTARIAHRPHLELRLLRQHGGAHRRESLHPTECDDHAAGQHAVRPTRKGLKQLARRRRRHRRSGQRLRQRRQRRRGCCCCDGSCDRRGGGDGGSAGGS